MDAFVTNADHTLDTVLALLRNALWEEKVFLPPEVHWASVYQELKNHAIVSVVDNQLMKYCPDAALKAEWRKDIFSRLYYNEQNLYGQDCLLTLLKENGIPTVILKGAAAAQYYPRPMNRTFGDVDFLVPAERFEETLTLLKEHGYQQQTDVIEGYCEVLLTKDHVAYELHRGVNANGGVNVDLVDACALEGLNHVKHIYIDQYCVPVLPELANGLVLLSHMRQHMRKGLGLRQVIDWMLYVNNALHDGDWQEDFQDAARKCEIEQLAITITRMCQLYLGLSDQITWCKNADEVTCAALMSYIVNGGNFGRKIEAYTIAAQRTMMQKNFLWRMITGLQRKGKNRPIVKKHPMLRPFAWAVQLGHYAKQTLKRGNMFNTLREDKKKANETQELFEALGITFTEFVE